MNKELAQFTLDLIESATVKVADINKVVSLQDYLKLVIINADSSVDNGDLEDSESTLTELFKGGQ